jgi:hypothetical protein
MHWHSIIRDLTFPPGCALLFVEVASTIISWPATDSSKEWISLEEIPEDEDFPYRLASSHRYTTFDQAATYMTCHSIGATEIIAPTGSRHHLSPPHESSWVSFAASSKHALAHLQDSSHVAPDEPDHTKYGNGWASHTVVRLKSLSPSQYPVPHCPHDHGVIRQRSKVDAPITKVLHRQSLTSQRADCFHSTTTWQTACYYSNTQLATVKILSYRQPAHAIS